MGLLGFGCAAAPTLVDEDPGSGFAIYRSGQLSEFDLRSLCEAGVEEILVLDGTATERECAQRETACPGGLRVRYDFAQSTEIPVSEEFLEAFDVWVEGARKSGKKIAFHCRHGWHRAGRLAAYYRMRFQGVEPELAINEMIEMGRLMNRHPQLVPQVEAQADWLENVPCSVDVPHCPVPDASPEEGLTTAGGFAADVCAGTERSESSGSSR